MRLKKCLKAPIIIFLAALATLLAGCHSIGPKN